MFDETEIAGQAEAYERLTPFFTAAAPQDSSPLPKSRYFLGYRLKDPGGDLVLFRHDGYDDAGQPRGGAFIFHYAGYNNGQGGDIPQLAPMHNIRNTFLFEVSSKEYKRVEDMIDMMRGNGVYNPFYFSRPLSPIEKFEVKGREATDYSGAPNPLKFADAQDYRLRPGTIPFSATNCVYLATQILHHHSGVDLSDIDPGIADMRNGKDLTKFMEQVRAKMKDNSFSAQRCCLLFSEQGILESAYKPPVKPADAAPALQI